MDIQAAKKRAAFAVKNYGRLGSTWAEFYGRDVPAALEALEEAQGRIAELENALRAAQTYVKAVRPTVGESE